MNELNTASNVSSRSERLRITLAAFTPLFALVAVAILLILLAWHRAHYDALETGELRIVGKHAQYIEGDIAGVESDVAFLADEIEVKEVFPAKNQLDAEALARLGETFLPKR